MADENKGTPKIIVDDDWKAEAQKEKEQADEQTRDMPGPGDIPDASFPEVIQMIAMQAMVSLGGAQDPQTGQPIPPNLPVAKHFIDLLQLLQDRTRNNLQPEEQRLLDGTTHELHMAYVEITNQAAQANPPKQD